VSSELDRPESSDDTVAEILQVLYYQSPAKVWASSIAQYTNAYICIEVPGLIDQKNALALPAGLLGHGPHVIHPQRPIRRPSLRQDLHLPGRQVDVAPDRAQVEHQHAASCARHTLAGLTWPSSHPASNGADPHPFLRAGETSPSTSHHPAGRPS
jgi:hypothetical protein